MEGKDVMQDTNVVVGDVLNDLTVREWVLFKRIASLRMTFLTRHPISIKPKLLNPDSLMKNIKSMRLKSNNLAQSSTNPNLSTTYISQSMESQSPWIIDSCASDYTFGNTSLFSSLSFLENLIHNLN